MLSCLQVSEACLFMSFVPFEIRIFAFCILIYKSSLCILETNPLHNCRFLDVVSKQYYYLQFYFFPLLVLISCACFIASARRSNIIWNKSRDIIAYLYHISDIK